MKTILTLKNTNHKVDPINFNARTGDLAQHLLCFDQIVLHSNLLSELPSLIEWLDPDSFLYLLKSDSLSFILTDWNIGFIKNQNRIIIPAVFLLDLNKEKIDYSNQFVLENKISEIIEKSGKFQIDRKIENLINEIAKKTSINEITPEIFQISFYKYIAELQKQPNLRGEHFLNTLILNDDGLTVNDFYLKNFDYSSEKLSKDLLKIAFDFFHYQTAANDPNIVINNADLISSFDILKEENANYNGFEHLVKMNGLPLVTTQISN